MAEIKTPGEASLGDAQLQGYVNAYNAAQVTNKAWARDSGWDPSVKYFWLGAADPTLANTFGVITANLNGVIVYQTFDRFSPPPVTVPVPVPLPVVEKITNDIYSYLDSFRPNPILAIPREVITQTILAGAALGTAGVLIARAVPAIAAYFELGEATTALTSFA